MVRKYTKKLIYDVFIDLLNKKPLDKITVTEISEICDINRNTFYYHYQDIYEIISEIFQTELKKAIDEYNDTLEWEESFLIAAEFALKNRKAIYNIYNSMSREALEKYIYDIAGNIMERYVYKKSKEYSASTGDIKLISAFYQCALTEMVLRWVAGGMKEAPEIVIKRIGQLFNGNIATSLERSENLEDIWENKKDNFF